MMSLFFDAVTSIGTAVGAVVAAVTLIISQRQQKKGLERERKQATLDAYSRLQEQVFDKINFYFPSEIRTLAEDTKSEKYKELSGYLARIEHFCVGLENGIYDYDTFYSLAHGYFDDEKGILKPRLLPLLERKLDHAETDYFSNIHAAWKKMDEMTERKRGL